MRHGEPCGPSKYIVWLQDSRGARYHLCMTEAEVSVAMGACNFGALYSVYSPIGLDCSDYIPF